MKPSIVFAALVSLLAGIVVLSGATPVEAAVQRAEAPALLRGFNLDGTGCNGGAARTELMVVRDQIADAPSLEAARMLALDQTRLARKALGRARWVIPFHPAIGEARAKIGAFEVEVRSAESQAEVAGAFGTLVRLASAKDLTVVDADIKADCEYTTGEIVIIVIGFFLAIIPGIIFMAILC